METLQVVQTLSDLSKRHAQYGVQAEEISDLFDCLFEIAEEILGDAWTAEMDAAWKGTWTGIRLIMEPTLIAASCSIKLSEFELEQIDYVPSKQQEVLNPLLSHVVNSRCPCLSSFLLANR